VRPVASALGAGGCLSLWVNTVVFAFEHYQAKLAFERSVLLGCSLEWLQPQTDDMFFVLRLSIIVQWSFRAPRDTDWFRSVCEGAGSLGGAGRSVTWEGTDSTWVGRNLTFCWELCVLCYEGYSLKRNLKRLCDLGRVTLPPCRSRVTQPSCSLVSRVTWNDVKCFQLHVARGSGWCTHCYSRASSNNEAFPEDPEGTRQP